MLLLYRWLDLMILALVFIVLLTIMAAVRGSRGWSERVRISEPHPALFSTEVLLTSVMTT